MRGGVPTPGVREARRLWGLISGLGLDDIRVHPAQEARPVIAKE